MLSSEPLLHHGSLFGFALSSLGPPFPPFGLPANQGSFHFYLGSSTFWNPAQQGASGGSAEDVKATPLRIWGGSVVDVLITSLVVIRLSWAAGYLEIRNFAPGNTAACAAGQHSGGGPGERGAAQRSSTGSRTARQQRHAAATQQQADRREQRQHRQTHGNKSNVFPQASPVFSFFGEGCGGPLLLLPGPVLSLCAGEAGKKSSDSPPHAPHQWPRPARRAGAPVATLEAGDPAATREAPGERGRAGPRHRHHRHRGCQGRRRTTQREHRHQRQPPAAPAHAQQAGPGPAPSNRPNASARTAGRPRTGNTSNEPGRTLPVFFFFAEGVQRPA